MSVTGRVRALERRFEAHRRLRTEPPLLAQLRREAEAFRLMVARGFAVVAWTVLGDTDRAARLERRRSTVAEEYWDEAQKALARMDDETRRQLNAALRACARQDLQELDAARAAERQAADGAVDPGDEVH